MTRKLLFSFVALIASAGLFATKAQDQSSARGNLSGVVYDASKGTVAGAQVTITGPIGSLSQDTTEQGTFLFSTLIPGSYSVKVQKTGFKIAEFKRVEVLINKTTSIEAILETGEVTQVVEVSAATVTVDTSSSSIGADIPDTLYQNIPVQRGVASLFYLSPGAVDGLQTGGNNPSISGSSGLENAYVADGVSINDPAFGGLGVWARAYGALGSGINLSFVKEVQVKTGGFEPQYGHASGGIVQIVTKSGGTKTFGEVAGFFKSRGMQATPANADDFQTQTLFGRRLETASYEGSAELGGYVPLWGLKKHLFYFGNFNPIFNNQYVSPAAGSGLFSIYNGEVNRRTNSYDYAGKLTYKISDRHTIETSIFGDPSHTNHVPWSTLNATETSVNSKWDFGTRNWAVRYDGALSSTWLVDAAFTWSWNHFTETPSADIVQITDDTQTAGLSGQAGAFVPQGFGFLEPYDSNTRSITGDTSKSFHFAGQHTLSVGYTWQFPVYDDITKFSGGKFTLPSANASGGDPGYLNKTDPTVAGKQSDAQLLLQLASNTSNASGCTLCPYMVVPGYSTPQQVVLQQVRGRFDGGTTRSSGKYHAAYVNDSWEISKYATLNVGLRWEQQRLIGNLANKLFNDMWSPRVGFIVDPKGDRKTKIYANYGRYAFVLPLDAAVRELSAEDDILNAFWAPASTTTGCPAGTPSGAPCVVTNSDGSPNYSGFFVPDAAHLLDNATGGVAQGVKTGISGITPFQQGVRMEYTDEFVVGAEHQFRGGIVASVRYIDRRLKRVIEDEGGISVEQFNALANNGGGLNYFIGNPNSKSDIFVNPNEVTFGLGTTVVTDGSMLPAACKDGNGNPTPYVAYNQQNTFGQIVGSACFPSVNLTTWTDASGNLLPNALFGGEFQPDGKPDTYKDPKREYQAVEMEVNKAFSHNWALVANWRIARLQGNYEGAFRNDNNQADPGISSLFDLTDGKLGLLGQQQGIGPLNTDRRHVINVYTTYVLDKTKLKGLVLGSGVRVQSGVPLTTLVAQQAYQNAGEVPLFGRGDLGRAPVVGTVDAHVEYPWKINERVSLKFGFDVFNIANTKRPTLFNQNNDQGFGIPNPDFQKPYATIGLNGYFFTQPFSSRASLRLVF
jgi:Carboxypeptidase regulatory-like domain